MKFKVQTLKDTTLAFLRQEFAVSKRTKNNLYLRASHSEKVLYLFNPSISQQIEVCKLKINNGVYTLSFPKCEVPCTPCVFSTLNYVKRKIKFQAKVKTIFPYACDNYIIIKIENA